MPYASKSPWVIHYDGSSCNGCDIEVLATLCPGFDGERFGGSQQGDTYNKANGIWSILSSGNFTVDAATKAQAEKDISEDGYWGVKQTSERILDFATALTGGDPSQIEKMRAAFKKGYEQAEKTWGGKLPDISRQTYDAVMAGFDKMAEDAGLTTKN